MAVKHPCRQNIWNTENQIFGTQKIKYSIWNIENQIFGTQKINQSVNLYNWRALPGRVV